MPIRKNGDDKRNQAIRTAESILNSSLDIIGGVRQLISILQSVDGDITESKAYSILQGFDSQTDHLPLGHDRNHYSPKYLEELDKEIADYGAAFGPQIKDTCRELVKMLKNSKI
jgi:hypothetical protein